MATVMKAKKSAAKKPAATKSAAAKSPAKTPASNAPRKTAAAKTGVKSPSGSTAKAAAATKSAAGKDARPPVAIGHVRIETHKVPETIDFFLGIGMRHIFRNGSFAVLELRGGTHLIVSRRERAVRKGTPAPFDIMVDDVHATHTEYQERGWEPTGITSGSVHSSFHVDIPSGHRLKVTSSHAGNRPV